MGLILARYFNFEALGTNFRTETTAGVTTYMTMVYIVFLQPAVLSQAGMDFGSVMMATCLSAALASFVMGVYANYPIGLAPGMGENFFFAITVVLGMGVSWQAALACVFASGVIFILLAIVRLREMIIDSIPASLKAAIATGIGLFIAFIGLVHAGIVKGPPTEVAALGDLHSPPGSARRGRAAADGRFDAPQDKGSDSHWNDRGARCCTDIQNRAIRRHTLDATVNRTDPIQTRSCGAFLKRNDRGHNSLPVYGSVRYYRDIARGQSAGGASQERETSASLACAVS